MVSLDINVTLFYLGSMDSKYIPQKNKTFLRDIGQKSTIQRKNITGDAVKIPNENLAKIGLSLNPLPKNLDYKGSAALHIYWNETLKQVFFISQTQPLQLYSCPEILAQKGFDDLLSTLKESYGHNRPKLRSGF